MGLFAGSAGASDLVASTEVLEIASNLLSLERKPVTRCLPQLALSPRQCPPRSLDVDTCQPTTCTQW